ncbi:hypothetical protein [Frankia sp. EAN1pec]|uniref:pyroglutamyl-peptidase I family protein n=1 Tax=Parafrankia sp. (strain EAN1pec) TaxID=298653 RepID=UPI0018DD0814
MSGFERYGTTPVDPAQGVAEALDGTEINDAAIIGLVVPSRWFDCIDVVTGAIDRTAPDLVVMLGEYGGRSMITVERIAQNLNDSARYGVADNGGRVAVRLRLGPPSRVVGLVLLVLVGASSRP